MKVFGSEGEFLHIGEAVPRKDVPRTFFWAGLLFADQSHFLKNLGHQLLPWRGCSRLEVVKTTQRPREDPFPPFPPGTSVLLAWCSGDEGLGIRAGSWTSALIGRVDPAESTSL